jgi:hypothetical protein
VRKTIKTEREQIIICCDLCARQADNADKCWLCRKEVCRECCKLFFYTASGSNNLIDLPMKLCLECQKHEQMIDKIQAILDGANKQLVEWVGRWKAAATK